MSVPAITTLRSESADIIAVCGRGQIDAILAGAIAAAATGGPLSGTASAQSLITDCQPLIDQADNDARSIMLRYFLKYLALSAPGVITVGVDGSNWVFKNGNGYLLFDDGLYRKEVGVMVEGQPQSGYENTGYTYANIP
jgi:hypothetical protein